MERLLPASGSSNTITGTAGADVIQGGAQADTITSGAGNDTVQPLAGADMVDAGAGNDAVESLRDDAQDRISCGPGQDSVFADKEDLISSDCEQVNGLSRPPAALRVSTVRLHGVKLAVRCRAGCDITSRLMAGSHILAKRHLHVIEAAIITLHPKANSRIGKKLTVRSTSSVGGSSRVVVGTVKLIAGRLSH